MKNATPMITITRTIRQAVLLALCALGAAAAFASPQFQADTQALTRGANRLTGSPEYAAAADYVAGRLRAAGADQVIVHTFPTARLVVKRCDITVGGKTLPLQPMRPNGIITPVTPVEGLTGELLYVGDGELSSYHDSPLGRIVVMDYNAGANWLRAFRLGAKAVIFVKNGASQSWQPHYTDAATNLPRFYFAGSSSELLYGSQAITIDYRGNPTATIHSEVTWEAAVGRNIIARVKGSDTLFGKEQTPETMIVSAPLDSYGEVPGLAPGARGAANCAALLQMAEYTIAHRPRRDTVFAFFDAQALGHAGVSAFYRIFEETTESVKLANRQKYQGIEQQFSKNLASALQKPDTLTTHLPVYNELSKRIRDKAAEHVYVINAEMEDLRKAVIQLKDTGDSAKIAVYKTTLAKDDESKKRWNALRTALGHHKLQDARSADLKPLFLIVINEALADVAQRQHELDNLKTQLAAEQDIKKLFTFRGKDNKGKDKVQPYNIILHVSLDFGDTTSRWGLLIGGDSYFRSGTDQPGLYGQVQNAILTATDELAKAGTPVPQFERATADGTLNTRLFLAAPLIHSGEIAGRFGIFNLALGTAQERMPREGTPDDTLAELNLNRIEQQATEAARVLNACGSSEGLSLSSTISKDLNYAMPEVRGPGNILGPSVMGASLGSAMPNKPIPGAVVQFMVKQLTNFSYKPELKTPGFENFQVLVTDANANYSYGPVMLDTYNAMLRGFAVKLDDRGEVQSATDVNSLKTVATRLNMVLCSAMAVRDGERFITRRYGSAVITPQLDSADTKVMQAIANGPLDPGKAFFATLDGVAYWYCERRVEDVKLFGIQSIVGLVSGNERSGFDAAGPHSLTEKLPMDLAALGTGYSLLDPWTFPESSLRSAADSWRLNESRLDILRSRGVMNGSLEELHGRMQDLLDAAASSKTVARREALATSAFLSARPVYNSVRMSLDDLVRAVLLLLVLAIPFAFALERLIIGATNIYRQIGWFAVFFTATFLILLLVHPAFAVSKQPIIIFLAFALMVLSSLVIFVIVQKFEQELKVLQGLTSTVHTADVSRFNTMMAAVGMGISTMRRRPLRTALSALTITLLTFTILNFASFDTRTGIVTLFPAPAPKYTGVLLHRVDWAPLESEMATVIDGRWSDQGTVTARYWLPASLTQATAGQGCLLSLADGSKPTAMKGVLGLDPREIACRADLRALLGADGAVLKDGIFITETQANAMNIVPGQQVMLGGIPLRVAGILNAAKMTAAKDMDSTGILPVDYAAMGTQQPQTQLQQQMQPTGADVLAAAQNRQDWVVLSPDAVAVVSTDVAKRLGASLRVVTLYTGDAQASAQIGEELARMLPMPVTATRPEGVLTHVLAPTVMAKGLKDLIFPILLGGLVIFGTMLGSVADREREIYTFSALGLAPAHVATLFFAEAMVYSFIGGIGGYLLAQGVMKLLTFLAGFGLLAVPEMNYSSGNAIVTILIVMATVLVSAIYPAFKASRSANPGILRAWRVPAPDGDTFHITFPFTVSQYDITGVMSFLKEHFDNFTDTSLGVFMTRDTRIERRDGSVLGLSSLLALAPFDLGVTQDFALFSAPSEIPGIDEVKIEITRRSGQHKDWQRLNKVLLDDLRRQFLIWRALPQDTMEIYRHRTLIALGEMAPEEAEPAGARVPEAI